MNRNLGNLGKSNKDWKAIYSSSHETYFPDIHYNLIYVDDGLSFDEFVNDLASKNWKYLGDGGWIKKYLVFTAGIPTDGDHKWLQYKVHLHEDGSLKLYGSDRYIVCFSGSFPDGRLYASKDEYDKIVQIENILNRILKDTVGSVSYTHLTLPTIYSV